MKLMLFLCQSIKNRLNYPTTTNKFIITIDSVYKLITRVDHFWTTLLSLLLFFIAKSRYAEKRESQGWLKGLMAKWRKGCLKVYGKVSRVLKAVGQAYIQVSRVIKLLVAMWVGNRDTSNAVECEIQVRYRDDMVSFTWNANEKKKSDDGKRVTR